MDEKAIRQVIDLNDENTGLLKQLQRNLRTIQAAFASSPEDRAEDIWNNFQDAMEQSQWEEAAYFADMLVESL